MASLSLISPAAAARHRPPPRSPAAARPIPLLPFLLRGGGGAAVAARAYRVTVEHEGERRTMEVEEGETILERALEEGMEVPHDCKLGVCMTCPARLLSGAVDQSEGMLSDDVIDRGYALLCVSYPRSDCAIRVIPEEELLSLQLATAND